MLNRQSKGITYSNLSSALLALDRVMKGHVASDHIRVWSVLRMSSLDHLLSCSEICCVSSRITCHAAFRTTLRTSPSPTSAATRARVRWRRGISASTGTLWYGRRWHLANIVSCRMAAGTCKLVYTHAACRKSRLYRVTVSHMKLYI